MGNDVQRVAKKSIFFLFIILLSNIIFLNGYAGIYDSSTSPALDLNTLLAEPKSNSFVMIQNVGKFKNEMAVLTQPSKELIMTLNIIDNNIAANFDVSLNKDKKDFEICNIEKVKVNFTDGQLISISNRKIVFKTPEKSGTHKINFEVTREQSFGQNDSSSANKKTSSEKISLYLIVGYSAHDIDKGVINGYPIGIYPDENAASAKAIISDHRENYTPPSYFYNITPENENLFVSEHFRLIDFTMKSERGKNRYISLKNDFINRLEDLQTRVTQSNLPSSKIKIIRSFISPNELRILKKKGVKLSEYTRFQYGDAAAVIIDDNNDNIMDDLNGDGRIDAEDVKIIEELVRDIERETRIYGGLGIMEKFDDPDSPDTPYLLFDMRGFSSRW